MKREMKKGIRERIKGIRKEKVKKPYVTAVIAASGVSSRMGGEDKLYVEIGGIPVVAQTLIAYEKNENVDEIIVTAREERIVEISRLCKGLGMSKVSCILRGGETRSESVYIGVQEAAKRAEVIAIHDGARPLVTQEVINKAIRVGIKYGAAIAAVPVRNTIKRVGNGVVMETESREALYEAQTPQVFRAELINAALTRVRERGIEVTDDSMAVEMMGVKVYITEGAAENIKITVAGDIEIAEAIMERRKEE